MRKQFNIQVAIFMLIFCCSTGQPMETQKSFITKYLEKSLNTTKNNENFIFAPFEAYKLYKEIKDINSIPSLDFDTDHADGNDELTASLEPIQVARYKNYTANHFKNLYEELTMKARWSFNFQNRDTHKRFFHQTDSYRSQVYVDFLRKDDIFRFVRRDEWNASILELPLQLNEIKLLIILPDERGGLPTLRDFLKENVDLLHNLTQQTLPMTLVRVLMPRLHLQYANDLMAFYEELSENDVDFKGYNSIAHSCNLEFNERGIGRFEKTTVLFWNAYSYLRISPKVVDISHPFLFLITNKDGIQFFGQMIKL